MTAFARTHDDATWLTGNYVTVLADWQDLASKVLRGINGDRGGAWAPSSKIDFSSGNFQCNTHVLVAFGGSLIASEISSVPSGFKMQGAAEWPLFAEGHPFRSRTILTSMLGAVSDTPDFWMVYGASVCSVAISIQNGSSTISKPGALLRELRVHDGATLARATIHFHVVESRTKAPIGLPRFRIVRIDGNGTATTLASVATGADSNGWITPPSTSKSSGPAWYASGSDQTITYACDQNHVIDIANFTYWLEIEEEAGPPAAVSSYDIDGIVVREQKADVAAASVASIGLVTGSGIGLYDGAGVSISSRILVKNQADLSTNGIWFAPDGVSPWERSDDFDNVADLTPRLLVRVGAGIQNGQRLFELADPAPRKVSEIEGGVIKSTGDTIVFQSARPTGNAYTSVVCDFENIQDMRFQ